MSHCNHCESGRLCAPTGNPDFYLYTSFRLFWWSSVIIITIITVNISLKYGPGGYGLIFHRLIDFLYMFISSHSVWFFFPQTCMPMVYVFDGNNTHSFYLLLVSRHSRWFPLILKKFNQCIELFAFCFYSQNAQLSLT